MMKAEELERIRGRLTRRRDEIYEAHARVEDVRRMLMEPEIEFEETAQKESIADTLSQLDEQERQEIEAIDRALAMITLGRYGYCEVCGRRIGVKRLEALPWTSLCARDANQKAAPATVESQTAGSLPPEYEGLSGSELGEIIADELRQDGDVELEELRIALRRDGLHLEGFLPTEGQHRRLLEVVLDHMEFANVIDEVVVTRTPWEREDRAPGRKEPEDILEEVEAEETEVEMGPMASRKAGTPLVPSDVLVPEEK